MTALSYSDIHLVPRYSTLRSRADADTSVKFLGRQFRLPVIPANMQSVINVDIARWLSEHDYPYIYHRFGDTLAFVRAAQSWNLISISVGVKEADKELLRAIVRENLRADWITVDVAHGHHISVKEMVEFIKSLDFKSCWGDYVTDSFAIRDGIAGRGRGLTSVPLSYSPKIIAGNVATSQAVSDLAKWGADCAKVGIGGSSVCTTRHNTGFGLPMFSCVHDICYPQPETLFHSSSSGISCGQVTITPDKPSIPIIADGGIREHGDIAKALVAGATMTMIGGMVAACTDAPGETIYDKGEWTNISIDNNGNRYEGVYHQKQGTKPIAKRFHGSASSRQKGEHKHVEGIEIEIPCNGLTIEQKYQEIKESLASSISYAGGTNLEAFKTVSYQSTK